MKNSPPDTQAAKLTLVRIADRSLAVQQLAFLDFVLAFLFQLSLHCYGNRIALTVLGTVEPDAFREAGIGLLNAVS